MTKQNRSDKKASSAVKNMPVVSDIPIPATANQLVIDLPDGQKLVIGTMATGAVIEVATWRGTGRPDSRTNRLMLGMSDPQATSAPSTASKSSGAATPNVSYSSTQEEMKKSTLPKVSEFVKEISLSALLNKPLQFIKSLTSRVNVITEKTKELEPIETTSEFNINQWIEQISQEAQAKVERSQSRKAPKAKKPNHPQGLNSSK